MKSYVILVVSSETRITATLGRFAKSNVGQRDEKPSMGGAAPVTMMRKHAKAEHQPAIVVPFIKRSDAVEEWTGLSIGHDTLRHRHLGTHRSFRRSSLQRAVVIGYVH
jgi:hypothetical protein